MMDSIMKWVIQQYQHRIQMQPKASTDIDRKLAIYYHPLFQQIIKIILDLFHPPSPSSSSPGASGSSDPKFEIGLLQFIQFNLKLQKALLPSFQIDNALISGLNDWVKQVAECLSYQGMVSTAGCVQVTSNNVVQLVGKQYSNATIKLFQSKDKYLEQITKVANHDAFKLLGVRINRQVFSKFMFDLCSTWCQFLDVELFSYFLIGLYIQISEGETIQASKFRSTVKISTIQFQFMEEFEEIKSMYSKVRRKELRYYRAWCQWNYLRVNEAGERLILKLDQIHPDDNRILQLAMVFERAIQVINEQITSQNPLKQQKKRKTTRRQNDSTHQNKDFLILKKFNLEPSQSKQAAKQKQPQSIHIEPQQPLYEQPSPYYQQSSPEDAIPQQFQIQIDEEGNMYLKRVVKLPIFGVKIEPKNFQEQFGSKREFLEKKKNQFRDVSNLYRKMENLKIRLQHNAKNDPYTFKKSTKIEQRDKFYQKRQKKVQQVDKTIHKKPLPQSSPQPQIPEPPNLPSTQPKVSLHETKQYIHKVMAPTFLTDNNNNLSYAQTKQGQIYSTSANDEKRNIRIGLPKIKNMEFRVKQIKSYHVVGKLLHDRDMINQRVKAMSIDMGKEEREEDKLERMKEENRHIWSRYIDQEEMRELNNYQEFYYKLQEAKRKFGQEFQSEFRVNLRPILAYQNKRSDIGGFLTKQDQQRFSDRIQRLINKQNRKNKKKMRKQKLRQYRNNFKSKKQKSLFEDIFINYHREAIKDIKQQRKRQSSMIVK